MPSTVFGVVVVGTTSVEVMGGHARLLLSMLSLWQVNHVCGVVHDLQQIHPLPTPPKGVLCWGEEGGVLYNNFQQGGWHLTGRVAPNREGKQQHLTGRVAPDREGGTCQ